MRKFWKWFRWVLLSLVVLAVLVGIPLAMHAFRGDNEDFLTYRNIRMYGGRGIVVTNNGEALESGDGNIVIANGELQPVGEAQVLSVAGGCRSFGARGFGGGGMMRFGGGGMMRFGGGMMPFGGFFMFFAWLIPLALLGLLVYGAYRLGKRNKVVVAAPAVVDAAPVKTCPKCGAIVQDGWNNCASCGKKL